MASAAAAYFGVREVVEGTAGEAARNAGRIMRFEQALRLDVEQPFQHFVLGHPLLVDLSNHIYVWLHWPFLILALVVVFGRDRRAYHRLTLALIASGTVGLVIFATFPASPPRFSPGFVGTVSQAQRQHFIPLPAEWSNRFASMPSFHAGWTLVAAIVLSSTMRSRLGKVLALLPGPLVTMAVIATGNHYVIDALVGCTLAVGALIAASWRPAARWSDRPARPLPALVRHDTRNRR